MPKHKPVVVDADHEDVVKKRPNTGTTDFNEMALRCKAILSDEFIKPVPLEKVVIASMSSPTHISPIMAELSQKLPLPHRLQHLKRVRQQHVILFPIRSMLDDLHQSDSNFWSYLQEQQVGGEKNCYINEFKSSSQYGVQYRAVCDYIRFKGVSADVMNLFIESILIDGNEVNLVDVAQVQPSLRWQFDLVQQHWPCKFHPNKNMEDKYSNTMFSESELSFHRLMFRVLRCMRLQIGEECGLAVNPITKRIVALAHTMVGTHPLMHCPMVLIDAVAKSQGAGAWNRFDDSCRRPAYHSSDSNTDAYSLAGVDESWQQSVHKSFPQVEFGACFATAGDSKSGPYLCTGYDVYLSREPCVMCAMAFVHSRARTVFYNESHTRGGLGSIAKVHTMRALNHHYNVYQIVY